ncbi:hypothetical protein DICPUDRAFT_57365 [Dictyostelium purpureum]|uniref:Uncharacterized protein n=1 Tax=Dictyostelium purpureum TaxID=5786 RepID=F0ZVN5_DICPU|nr:uncharacterized protein DICPUDRAFT_57365 [Dictyostelium purpureum]EGC31989.1 hypothetical protein DICPUDRAFT_57365 [Dictyostelium purpureum]|eukprot:XP_003291487.1 hypothetical protein DICPUDRAFT_57365 [Dictyostelium purpureum]
MSAVKKIKIGGGSFGEKKEFTIEEASKLFDIDDNASSPYSFKFDDSNDHLYFLSNVKGQSNIKNIHYIDINSSNKEIKPLFNYVDNNVELSLEDQLQRERQRVVANGITQFTYHQEHKFFVTAINNQLHKIDISESVTKPVLKEIPGEIYNHRLSSDGKLISYIKEKDIWVTDIKSGKMHRLTQSNDEQHKFRYAGDVGFIYAEEFSRYIGYWWSPVVEKCPQTNKSIYRILYFEEDETNVRDFHISTPDHEGDTTHYKYPLAGDKNSIVKVNLVEFSLSESGDLTELKRTQLFDLKEQFSWLEYYTRAGWLPNGKSVWLQLLDRKQQHQAVTIVPLSKFTSSPSTLPVIIEETTNFWINVVDSIHFFSDSQHLLWSSECNENNRGFRHLSLVQWDSDSFGNVTSKPVTQLLSNEEWMVSGEELFVDETRGLVYFIATKDTCLEQHLYVKSYKNSTSEIQRLTVPQMSHKSIKVSKDFKKIISTYSNHKTPNKTQIFDLVYDQGNKDSYPSLKPLFFISNSGVEESESSSVEKIGSFKVPEIFSFVNSRGIKVYGQYTKPTNFDPSKKHPTVLYVYGGPHVQLVRNTYSYIRQYYANFGFIQIMIDGAGSTNRGLEYEGQIKHKMGVSELQDQIEGIEYLINNNIVPIDRSRIAITGWSYGGYFSLMALSQRPDFFKIAISGAPVTFWEAYNTGYTERYMDTPENNKEGYHSGNVMTFIDGFPEEDNRLVVIHGLQDENVHFSNTSCLIEKLTTSQKPYILKILAKERHGIRNIDNRVYIEAFCVNHLLNNL